MAQAQHSHLIKPVILGYRRNGCPIWSVAGGSEPAGQPAPAPIVPAPAPSPAAPPTQPAAAAPADPGFPANTPLEQMNAPQREAYWKFHARKHEDRAKVFDGLTTEQLADLRTKAEKHDQLERDLLTGTERAVAEARDTATAETTAAFIPTLVTAKLEAAAAWKGITAESLQTALEYVDTNKFLSADRKTVDAAKVSAFVDGIAPATGNQQLHFTRKGPSATGHGNGLTGQPVTGRPGEAGAAMAEKRFGKKA